MKTQKRDSKYVWIYSLLLILLLGITFVPIVLKKEVYMFLDIGADTYAGNWPTIEQAVRWWREGIKSLWSFQIGLGANVFMSTDTYFDPFLIVLFPFRNPAEGITLMMFVKYSVLGMIAYKLYLKMGLREIPLIIASLCHTFSGFMVGWGQHYTFSTCFVLYTVLVYSIVRYQENKKWGLVTIDTAILCCFSLYFAYMSLLFTGFLVVVYYLFHDAHGGIKKAVRVFVADYLPLACAVLCGVMLSLPVFLQQLNILTNTSRVTGGCKINLELNSLNGIFTYVERSFSNVLSGISESISENNFYETPILYIGVIALYGTIACIIKSIKEKKKNICLLIIIGMACVVMFPNFIHPIFNGMSDNTTRWLFTLVPVMCFISAKGIEYVLKNDRRVVRMTCILGESIIALFGIIYCLKILPLFRQGNRTQVIAISVVLCVGILYGSVIWVYTKKREIFSILILVLVVFELGVNSYLVLDGRSISELYIKGQTSTAETNYFDGTTEVNKIISKEDNDFYRIAKLYDRVDLNAPLLENFRGETYYKSMVSKEFADFITKHDLRQANSNYFYGFDGQDDLRNIYGAKYLLSHEDVDMAGYEKIGKYGDVIVYVNKNSVGLSCTYDTVLNSEQVLNFEKSMQNSMLYDYCVSDTVGVDYGIPFIFDVRDKKVSYSTKYDSDNSTLWLHLDEGRNQSLQLEFECFEKESLVINYSVDDELSDELGFSVITQQKTQSWSIPLIQTKTIAIRGSKEALESIKNINIYTRKDSEVAEKARILKNSGMTITKFTENNISGSVNLDSEKMMVFSIPYDKGWKIYVDGQEEVGQLVNTTFLGVKLESGEHDIKLVYNPKSFIIGMYCMFGTLAVLFVFGMSRRIFAVKNNEPKTVAKEKK